MRSRLLFIVTLLSPVIGFANSVQCLVKNTQSEKKYYAKAAHVSAKAAKRNAIDQATNRCIKSAKSAHFCLLNYCKAVINKPKGKQIRANCQIKNQRTDQFFSASAEGETRRQAVYQARQHVLSICHRQSAAWPEACGQYQCKTGELTSQLSNTLERVFQAFM